MFRLWPLLLLTLAFAGCTVSEDERNFYYRGWVNPNEVRIDREAGPAHRAMPPGYKPDPLIDL